MNEKVKFSNVLRYAGAFAACAIGSGFATGQEIMQFFTGQGIWSILGTLVTTIVFSATAASFMELGFTRQLKDPAAIVSFFFGEKFGKVFEIVLQIFLFGVYVIMIAGAGSTLSEYFGLSPMVGRVLIAAVTLVTVILGLSRITDILGGLGVVIIFFAVGIGIYSFCANASGLSQAAELVPTLDITRTAGGWLWSSLLYPGFNAIVVMFLSCAIGQASGNRKESFWGGITGGVLFGLAILCMNLALLSNVAEIYSYSVPTLQLAKKISPDLAAVFSVIICCGIYTTAVPMLWGVVRHFAEDKTKKAAVITVALTALGLLLGMTDFKILINIIYPSSGYIGVLLMVLAIRKDILEKKKLQAQP